MPNWCSTAYKIIGSKEEIADLYKKIGELNDMSEPFVENGFGKLWLGCLINYLGGDWNKVYCRGEIINLELSGDEMIQLETWTAWVDMHEVWDFVCEKYPTLEYYYLSEEPGCLHYVNSDMSGEYFPEQYIIESWEGETTYAETEEDLFEEVAKYLEVEKIENFQQLDTLIKKYNYKNKDKDCISYHAFEAPNQ